MTLIYVSYVYLTWPVDPKSQLLDLSFQFAAALQELPKPFQEGANKALRAIETDFGGGGDYRNESPEINKYPRSQSSMAGKILV